MALPQIHKKYSKFIFDACKNSSKIGLPRAPIHQSISTSDLHTFPCNRTSILRNSSSVLQKRFYFKNREYDDDEGYWFHNPKRVRFTLFFFTCGIFLSVSSGEWVTVPYTERRHFVLFHKFLPKILEEEHTIYEDELLPPFHPYSITARRIFQNIIDQAFPIEIETKRSLGLGLKQSEEKANCEIIVLNSNEGFPAGSGRFGKMYVSAVLLHHYRKHEPMIATIFGGEVGRDLARHIEEKFSKFISVVSVTGLSVYLFWQSAYIRSKMPSLVNLMRRCFLPSFSFAVTVAMLSYLPIVKYYRLMEFEADRIGLMLAASAGYDPEVGVSYPVYEGVVERNERSVLPECFHFFPTAKTRNLYLAQPQVLDEAIVRYHRSTKLADETDSAQA